MKSWTLCLITLLSCGGEAPGDTGAAQDGDAGTWDGGTGPYTADEGDDDTVTVDTDAMGEALTELAVLLPTWNAGPLLDGYRAMMTGADEDCPAWYVSDGMDYWYDACTARSGTSFDGYALIAEYDDYVDEDGTVYAGAQFYGYATITDSEGDRFSGRGSMGLLTGTMTDGTRLAYSYMDRGFSWTGAEAAWLDSGVEAALVQQGAWYPDPGAGAMSLDGVVRGLDGTLEAVVFDQALVYDEALGGCPIEPNASLSVLEAQGDWIDILFDADPDLADNCDGCGQAWLGSRPIGEVCADFSPLLDWQQSPW